MDNFFKIVMMLGIATAIALMVIDLHCNKPDQFERLQRDSVLEADNNRQAHVIDSLIIERKNIWDLYYISLRKRDSLLNNPQIKYIYLRDKNSYNGMDQRRKDSVYNYYRDLQRKELEHENNN